MSSLEQKKVAIYCRISTHDCNGKRQESELLKFAEEQGYQVVNIFHENTYGTRQRKEVMKLASSHKINSILVTELARWGKDPSDLTQSVKKLHDLGISLIAQDRFHCDPDTDQGKMIFGIIDMLAEFARDSSAEKAKSKKSIINIIGKLNWFALKICVNILFAFLTTVLTSNPKTMATGLNFLVASVLISSSLNSLDSIMTPEKK
jgi:predicted site-specific integrase-resolvase